MTNRQILVAANWKMNGSLKSIRELGDAFTEGVSDKTPTEVVVCPSFVHLSQLSEKLNESDIKLGAQNVSHLDEGAYTGEVCASMLVDFGCEYVIVGHSERRMLYHETDMRVAEKFYTVQDSGMIPILCVGELLEERESNSTEEVIARQLDVIIDKGNIDAFSNVVIAYEPVWAIGTGMTADNEQVRSAHNVIRDILGNNDDIHIFYCVSVNSGNAEDLIKVPGVDGFLIGGASLDLDSFTSIARTIDMVQEKKL